jgi:hypothetical protein
MLTRYGTSLSRPSTPPTIRVGVMMPTKLANTCCNAANIAAVKWGGLEAVDQVGFIAGGRLSVRQSAGSGQKMEAQDARKRRSSEV